MMGEPLLEPHQEQLLGVLAEATRNVPHEKRHHFVAAATMGSGGQIIHEGLPGGEMKAYLGDLRILGDADLLRITELSHRELHFDVTPRGFAHYQRLKQVDAEPVSRVEVHVHTYINVGEFKNRHPNAYERWAEAERRLWESDSKKELTTIGHLCREAMQEFSVSLLRHRQPVGAPSDPSKTVDALRATLKHVKGDLASTERPFLDALLAYWGTVSDLVQRQEHGALKEGGSLVWRDARRVVFQTALVMFEVDEALSRAKSHAPGK